jgi:ATP-binding cassette, subfamily B (MDR/TAP), member 1
MTFYRFCLLVTLSLFLSVLVGAIFLSQSGPAFIAISKSQGSAYKVFSVIDRESEIDSLSDKGEILESVQGLVEFKNVQFRN